MRRPTRRCQSRNLTPNSRLLASTAGHSVETAPLGATTCLAMSESRGVEGFVVDFGTLDCLLLRCCLKCVDLLRVQRDLPMQRSQRRPLRIPQVRDHLTTLSDQNLEVGAA